MDPFGLSSRAFAGFLVIFSIIFYFFLSVANAVVIQLPPNEGTSLTSKTIAAKGVTIRVEDRPLEEVLQAIQGESGILFEISEQLREKTITATITAPDWHTAIQELLRPFNWAAVFRNNGTLQHVFLLQSGEDVAVPLTTDTNSAPPPLPPPLIPPPPVGPNLR